MNVKILDSWLREYLKTDAKPKEIAKDLSLTSVSIERTEKWNDDLLYDIEVTTNRPDLMSVVGLAREASAVLPQFGKKAMFAAPPIDVISNEVRNLQGISRRDAPRNDKVKLEIINNPELVNRVCAVVMEVTVKPSPQQIKDRLESSDIRSLNNLIDITNYVMRTIGHPAHVFDFDRLRTDKLIIRESKKGEEIETLDGKKHILQGGDIVADDGKGRIVDLLGIMGLENSVVTDQTKRILFFIDNNDPVKMRKTSISLGIRSEAAQLNEKGIDPELALDALSYGIHLYEKFADGKIISEIIDIYPKKPQPKIITVAEKTLEKVIGVHISEKKIVEILTALNLNPRVTLGRNEVSPKADEVTTPESEDPDKAQARMTKMIKCTVPTYRRDLTIPEDLIEEIARIYGYHNLPSVLPPLVSEEPLQVSHDPFFWETRLKHMLKYWGFTEVYTYSMVSEELLEGPLNEAVILKNPLDADHVYMRRTLVPSLLQVIHENKAYDIVNIFEIANVYEKNGEDLPKEHRILAGIVKRTSVSFYDVKGIVEQLGNDLGIMFSFKVAKESVGADVHIEKEKIGTIEELDDEIVDFELSFEKIAAHATLKKKFIPLAKYPPIVEDLTVEISEEISTGEIIEIIKKQSPLIRRVTLLDKYKNRRTFHIIYQSDEKSLTTEDIAEIRKKITASLQNPKRHS